MLEMNDLLIYLFGAVTGGASVAVMGGILLYAGRPSAPDNSRYAKRPRHHEFDAAGLDPVPSEPPEDWPNWPRV